MAQGGAAVMGDAALAVREVDFLVKAHLYGRQTPHPLPRDLPEEKRVIALYSFSKHGRRACFATYEDTTRVRVPADG